MNNYIRIKWPSLGHEVKALMLLNLNPYACREFIKTLPFKSIQSHAVVAGKQIYFPYRLIIDPSKCNYENMSEQPIGRINIELDFQYLSINYGSITEAVPALAIGQVFEEDIETLKLVGEKIWYNLLFSEDFIIAEVETLGGDDND